MARPDVSATAERIYGHLGAYHQGDEENGWGLLILCEMAARAIAKPTEALRHDDQGSGWRRMLDPMRTPAWALPWLAQFAGVRELPPGLTETQQREWISSAPGMRRGSLPALTAAIQRFLTGERRVTFYERDSSAYHLTIVTHAGETPDPDLVLHALTDPATGALPAGLVLDYHTVTGWSIGEMEAAYSGQTIGDLEGAFSTIAELEEG